MGSLSLSEAALNRVAQVALSDLRPLIYDLISGRVLFEEANTTLRHVKLTSNLFCCPAPFCPLSLEIFCFSKRKDKLRGLLYFNIAD
jgi:hypothetical protein